MPLPRASVPLTHAPGPLPLSGAAPGVIRLGTITHSRRKVGEYPHHFPRPRPDGSGPVPRSGHGDRDPGEKMQRALRRREQVPVWITHLETPGGTCPSDGAHSPRAAPELPDSVTGTVSTNRPDGTHLAEEHAQDRRVQIGKRRAGSGRHRASRRARRSDEERAPSSLGERAPRTAGRSGSQVRPGRRPAGSPGSCSASLSPRAPRRRHPRRSTGSATL